MICSDVLSAKGCCKDGSLYDDSVLTICAKETLKIAYHDRTAVGALECVKFGSDITMGCEMLSNSFVLLIL